MNAIHAVQRFLYQQTKQQPRTPVSGLMPLLTDQAVLREAWKQVARKNGGQTAGRDQLRAAEVKRRPGGAEEYLHHLAHQIQSGNYRPGPVNRIEIPKPNKPGETRPIVVLTLADRIVHTAFKLLLEPIVEARLGKHCFGFRPGRSRFDELVTVRRLFHHHPQQFQAGLAADVASCFDCIDHRLIRDDLFQLVADPQVTGLFDFLLDQVGQGQKGWLRTRRVGVLQGSALSPVLANVLLHRFDRHWQKEQGDSAPLLRYADDLLVLAPDVRAAERLQKKLAKSLWHTCRMELAEDKTVISSVDEGIDILGMRIARFQDPFSGEPIVHILVDPDSIRNIFQEVDHWAEELTTDHPLDKQFRKLNRKLRGWFATYQYAYDAPQAFTAIDYHVFRVVRDRLKELLELSVSQRQTEHHLYLRSGHETWQAAGESVMVLSAEPRQMYRTKPVKLPWEAKTVPATQVTMPSIAIPHFLPASLPQSTVDTGTPSLDETRPDHPQHAPAVAVER